MKYLIEVERSFYISLKQNIYLKTGLMKGVSLIFEDQRKCTLKGKLFTALLFMETTCRSCIMLPHNEDRLSQVGEFNTYGLHSSYYHSTKQRNLLPDRK